jgi:hypothetical protein
MTRLTGGCQCGAVRFEVEDVSAKRSSICHCRMCQKAFGAFYAPLVTVDTAKVKWTRGEPKRWRSSNIAVRGFCPDCGTPLTYETADELAVAIGAFDDPAAVAPTKQVGIEGELPFVAALSTLPRRPTTETDVVSYQHPDHDTETWPERRT